MNASSHATLFSKLVTYSWVAGRLFRSTSRYSHVCLAVAQFWHGSVREHFSWKQGATSQRGRQHVSRGIQYLSVLASLASIFPRQQDSDTVALFRGALGAEVQYEILLAGSDDMIFRVKSSPRSVDCVPRSVFQVINVMDAP